MGGGWGREETPTHSCPCPPRVTLVPPLPSPPSLHRPRCCREDLSPHCPSLPAASPACPTSAPATNRLKIFNSCLTPSLQGELAFKLRCFGEVNHASARAAVPAGPHGAPWHIQTWCWAPSPPCALRQSPKTCPKDPPWGWQRPGPPVPCPPLPLSRGARAVRQQSHLLCNVEMR